MGLDSYLSAEKRLNKKSKVDRQYISYFNTISNPEYIEQIISDEGLYISEYFNTKDIAEVLETMPKIVGQVGRIKTVKRDGDSFVVSTEAGYWRKANQIHNWFVEYCQGGIDECQKTMLSVSQLQVLQSKINTFGKLPSDKQLNEDKWKPSAEMIETACQLLPSTSGFFFGSTDYDSWYFSDIKTTKEILKSVMKQSTINNWQLSYQSSW